MCVCMSVVFVCGVCVCVCGMCVCVCVCEHVVNILQIFFFLLISLWLIH